MHDSRARCTPARSHADAILYLLLSRCTCPQLVRRNEEARLLYEKVRLQQSALARGQAQYRDRLAEFRALKLKVGGGGGGGGAGGVADKPALGVCDRLAQIRALMSLIKLKVGEGGIACRSRGMLELGCCWP